VTPVYKEEFGEWVAIRPFPDGYRLPTEAEWAWAIRYQGGNGALKFSWGKDWPPRRDAGNYADKSAADLVPTIIPGYDDGFASTAEGGKFPANAGRPVGAGARTVLRDQRLQLAACVADRVAPVFPGLRRRSTPGRRLSRGTQCRLNFMRQLCPAAVKERRKDLN
jgi:hypothetical protein